MPGLLQLAKRYQTHPIGPVQEAGSLGEYLCVGLADKGGEPLAKFDLDSGQSTRCDAWWRFEGEGFLVQARVSGTSGGRTPGIYTRIGPNTPYISTTILGVLHEATISREGFEGLLSLVVPLVSDLSYPPGVSPEFSYLGPIETDARA